MKKRILSLLLLMSILSSLLNAFPIMVSAENDVFSYNGENYETYYYSINNGEVTIERIHTSNDAYPGYTTTLKIPNEIEGYPVTKIKATEEKDTNAANIIRKIYLPETITTIRGTAFENLSNLDEIIYNGTETQWRTIYITDFFETEEYMIGYLDTYYVPWFYFEAWKSSINDVRITFGNASNDSDAENTCGSSLTWTLDESGTLTISGTGTMTDYTSFQPAPWYSNCASIKKVVIGDSVTNIGEYAFYGCYNLTSITIPNSVTRIDNYAFAYCTRLSDIILPDMLTFIGESAFVQCSNLLSVELPNGIATISKSAFSRCANLKNIIIPNGVTIIDDFAFSNCFRLTDISLPKGLRNIGIAAFSGCTHLVNVIMQNSVKNIEEQAFYECNSLTDIYYTGNEEDWNEISISNGNEKLTNATIHYNYSADTPSKTYSASFNLNGGSGSCPEQDVSEGGYVVVPDKPTREGYVFTGWYANKICSGQPYITSAGAVNKKVTSDIVLYAGWKKTDLIEWGKDTFNFGNNSDFWGNSYYISDEYYNILTKDLNWLEKLWMDDYRDDAFGGSCFGVTEVMALLKLGQLEPWYFDKDAKIANDLDYPKDNKKVASLINYYFLSQHLPDVEDSLNADKKTGTKKLAQKLVNALKNIDKTGVPVVLNYEFKTSKWDLSWGGHSILAYKIEDDGTQYKIYIADPNWLVQSDRNAPELVYIQGEPKYMYISYDFEELSYDGNDTECSTVNGTLRLHSVMSDTSLYENLNIQEKLTNQCVYNPSIALLSLEENEIVTELSTNYSNFVITDGVVSSSVSDNGVEGDLDISESNSKIGTNLWASHIYGEGKYTITPSADIESYKTMIMYNNSYQSLISVESEDKPIIYLSPNEGAKITSENKGNKSVTISIDNANTPWNNLTVSADVTELSVLPLEGGSIEISSNASLKDASIIVNQGNNNLQTIVTEDTNSVIVGYFENGDKKYVNVEGLNEIINQEITYTVAFYTLGGNVIDSLTSVMNGNTIVEPQNPVKEGYKFNGWYSDETYIKQWNFETDVVTDNLNLYAKWEEDPDYYKTITLVSSDEKMQVIVKTGETVLLEEYVDLFNKKGYELLGWNTTDDESNVEHATNASLKVDSDITLYAVLKAVPYTVSTVTKGNGSCKVETSIYNISDSCDIIVVGYKNKQLVSLQRRPYSQANETFTLSNDLDEIKVMIWDGLTKLKPLCDAEVINCEQWINNQ